MCGRYASTRTDDQLVAVMAAADVVGEQLPPSWNVELKVGRLHQSTWGS